MALARRITVGTSATVLNPADDGLDGERVTIINPDKIGGVTNTTVMPVNGTAQANTLALYNDTVHAKAKGYAMLADLVASFIAP